MIIRSVSEVIGTDRDVHGEGWKSRRLVLAEDGIGYSLHETTLEPGIELRFEYRRHRETVYCVEGEGSVEDVASGRRVLLRPGSMYSAGVGEPHVVRTETHVKVMCVFTPGLTGSEEADWRTTPGLRDWQPRPVYQTLTNAVTVPLHPTTWRQRARR